MSLLEERAKKKEHPFGNQQQAPIDLTKTGVAVNPDDIRKLVRNKLLTSGDISIIYTDEGKVELKKKVFDIVSEQYPGLTRMERSQIAEEIVMDITGYGPIQPLIQDPEITDILINRYDRIYFEKGGRMHRSQIQFRNEQHLNNLIEKIVANVGRRIDESQPLVDARMPDGSRICAAIRPINADGPSLFIRRFQQKITVDDLLRQGVLTTELLKLLEQFILARLNIVVSGGTGTGKTTFLRILAQMIPQSERVITVEEVTELNLKIPNVTRLETRKANIEGKGEVDAQQLVAASLRMRPDRIIVGECRRGEAFDMLQAMNTGHEGSLTTLHANTPQDALFRLENMVLMAGYELPLQVIREYIASAIHIVIHLTRLRSGARVVSHISEVLKEREGKVSTIDLYRRKDGALVKVNEPSENLTSLLEVEQ